MSSNRDDDDALRWAGDAEKPPADGRHEEPGLPEGWSRPQPASSPGRAAASPELSRTGVPGVDARTGERRTQPSSIALVGLGILGGVYLLYTVAWFIAVVRLDNPIGDPVGQFMFSLGTWFAVAAPAVWFAVVYLLTGSRARARVLWLLAGVVLLVPVPVILGGGASA